MCKQININIYYSNYFQLSCFGENSCVNSAIQYIGNQSVVGNIDIKCIGIYSCVAANVTISCDAKDSCNSDTNTFTNILCGEGINRCCHALELHVLGSGLLSEAYMFCGVNGEYSNRVCSYKKFYCGLDSSKCDVE